MSTAALFLDIKKAFDIPLHSGLLYKLPALEFFTSLIKLIASFLTDRKFKHLAKCEFSTPRKIAAGVPQGSDLAPILYSLYKNDAPAVPGIVLLCLRTIPVFTQKRNTNVVFSANCNVVSLQ
jgi:hypothetical protein